MDFGRQRGRQNRAKIDTKRHRKNNAKKIGSKIAKKAQKVRKQAQKGNTFHVGRNIRQRRAIVRIYLIFRNMEGKCKVSPRRGKLAAVQQLKRHSHVNSSATRWCQVSVHGLVEHIDAFPGPGSAWRGDFALTISLKFGKNIGF